MSRHQNITARIVADSINPSGSRLTSFIFTYPRFIHAELMTHRMFSRNAASSRAIPIKKMIEAVENNPATFEYWGSANKGMQAGEQLCLADIERSADIIRDMRECCVNGVLQLETIGLAKQNSNRYLEAFGHITVLVTATDIGWENFFALRAHKAAQPEFQVLAFKALNEYVHRDPDELNWGEWHFPKFRNTGFKPERQFKTFETDEYLKIITARCARLSYLTFDGEHSPEKDIETHDKLVKDGHWSPFEHPAQAINDQFKGGFKSYPWSNYDWGGIQSGWGQYRKMFDQECRECDLATTLASKPDWVNL